MAIDISSKTAKKIFGLTVMITRVRVAMGDSRDQVSQDIINLYDTAENEDDLVQKLMEMDRESESKAMAQLSRAQEYLSRQR